MPIAGHLTQVAIRTDNTAATIPADELDGANSIDFSISSDLLDVSDFAGSAWKQKLSAMKDAKFSAAGDAEPANTAFGRLLTASQDGSSVWATYNWNVGGSAGQVGVRQECKVESLKINSATADRVTFSAELSSTAAPTIL